MTPYYSQDNITIFHGDCREVLPGMTADVVATDPPYGVGFRDEVWDNAIPQWWLPLARSCAEIVAFTTAPLTLFDYPRPDWIACWARPASNSRTPQGGFNHWSPIAVYGRHKLPVDLISLHAISHAAPAGYAHPCPKPVALFRWLLSSLLPNGGKVIDPFMGSGATLEAAKVVGLSAIGIEIEERYCELAANRLAQGVLFGAAT